MSIYADYDSVATFKLSSLSSNLTTIQYSRQMRPHAISEIESETDSLLP